MRPRVATSAASARPTTSAGAPRARVRRSEPAERLLDQGFDGMDLEDTVRQGVSDYLAVRAAHPAAPSYLASYEMRTSDAVDHDMQFAEGFTIREADFDHLREVLEDDDTAAVITAGGYTFTAAQTGGVFGVFDSHINDIHGRAYTRDVRQPARPDVGDQGADRAARRQPAHRHRRGGVRACGRVTPSARLPTRQFPAVNSSTRRAW